MLTNSMTYGATELGKVVQDLYAQGETDYSLEPVVLTDSRGKLLGVYKMGMLSSFAAAAANAKWSLPKPLPNLDSTDFHAPIFRT